MEISTPCKYKTVKDIEKPFGIYNYVGESSCCAKIYRNRIIHFGWANRGSFSFFTYKHTDRQTDKQILSPRLQVTNMDRIERIKLTLITIVQTISDKLVFMSEVTHFNENNKMIGLFKMLLFLNSQI